MTKDTSKIADSRSDQMMLLQDMFLRGIEQHLPPMTSQSSAADLSAVTADLFAVLANVAIGHLEKRANAQSVPIKAIEAASGASRIFTETCKKIAFYQTQGGAENTASTLQ